MPEDRNTAVAPADFVAALTCLQRGELERAESLCEELLRQQPLHFDTWHLRGLIACERKQLEQAVGFFQRSLELSPRQPAVLANRGQILVQLMRFDEALACFDGAAALEPPSAITLYGRGCALLGLKRAADALSALDEALAQQPNLVAALVVRGTALQSLQRFAEALQSYERASLLQPELASTCLQRGLVLMDLQQPQAALAAFDQALQRTPNMAEAHQGRGIALTRLQKPEEAAEAFARCLAIRDDLHYVRGQALHAFLQQADWHRSTPLAQSVIAANARGEPADEPFSFLSVSASPRAQLACARRYISDWYPPREPPFCDMTPYSHERIRVAYLSADFGEHPVSYLMAGVFERHDRQRFEVLGVALRPVATGGYGARIRAALEQLHEVGTLSDAQIARFMRDREVDIVVDLMGFTRGARLGVLAHRPAPVQLSYLGYPGTLGAPYIDYLLADTCVIPPQQRQHYSESIVWLPECFQANDDARALPAAATRAEAGLPDTGFVFCSFNASYKITAEIFALWCRLLRAVPDSVLWLLGERESTRRNLLRAAGQHGVSAQRLIFAERASYTAHLARLRCADLFLDTPIFNAGTSASDALWAEVPVLTCPGEALAARMAASLLQAIGLPELICPDLTSYERRALELARDATALLTLRQRLSEHRRGYPLFDTARFCRHLELAYQGMWARNQRGEPPTSFSVDPLPPDRA